MISRTINYKAYRQSFGGIKQHYYLVEEPMKQFVITMMTMIIVMIDHACDDTHAYMLMLKRMNLPVLTKLHE